MSNTIKNIFDTLQHPNTGDELFTTLLEHKNIKIELIHSHSVENGKWYRQTQDEWVLLLKGEATLELEGVMCHLGSGDSLFIEKNRKHRVLQTDAQTLWLTVHIF